MTKHDGWTADEARALRQVIEEKGQRFEELTAEATKARMERKRLIRSYLAGSGWQVLEVEQMHMGTSAVFRLTEDGPWLSAALAWDRQQARERAEGRS